MPLATTMEFCFRNKLLSFAERYVLIFDWHQDCSCAARIP
jgi:hypothetical protein